MMRIGQGYDVHRLREGRKLILGGVTIPHPTGLDGHSDADVLLHAICDALLGALALGDIGQHFSPDDPQYKDANSQDLLRQVARLIQKKGYEVANIDSTIIAEKPQLSPHIKAMRSNIADCLGLRVSQVSVKATTTEKLGFAGQEQGIAAQAVCLLSKDWGRDES